MQRDGRAVREEEKHEVRNAKLCSRQRVREIMVFDIVGRNYDQGDIWRVRSSSLTLR